MDKQIDVDPSARADNDEHAGIHDITPDIAYQCLLIVNVVFIGAPNAGSAPALARPRSS